MHRGIVRFSAWSFLVGGILWLNSLQAFAQPDTASSATWNFAVSGDSRNCGDVVMPSIAADAQRNQAAFYLHLGDLRAIYKVDEDLQHSPEWRGQTLPLDRYQKIAWDDFVQSQLAPFGNMPVYVGIGNHETIAPMSRAGFVAAFADWLNAPVLRQQRLADDPKDYRVRPYYHWIQGGVDFIYLDNASRDQFDAGQINWIEGVLKRAAENPQVRSLVVGMHAALPYSLSAGHSMNESEEGIQGGGRVYLDLLNFREKTGKRVYVLASHSHFYMTDIYNTAYWRAHGGVLPGWIIGTGGAVRYALPEDALRAEGRLPAAKGNAPSNHAPGGKAIQDPAHTSEAANQDTQSAQDAPPTQEALQKTYGYLLATVHPDGAIDFRFHEFQRSDVPDAVVQRYTSELVDFCFNENTDFPKPKRRPESANALSPSSKPGETPEAKGRESKAGTPK